MFRAIFLLLIFFISCNQKRDADNSFAKLISAGRWIDLSYDFSDKTLYWPTAGGFRLDTAFNGVTPAGFYYSAYNFCAAEHGGTHLDAPVHFAKGRWSADEIPLENLIGEAVVIDVSEKALKNPDYQVTGQDFQDWEKNHRIIPDNSILLIRTGYGSFYPDAKKYLGTDERGAEAVAKLHFPGIHPDAATWLVAKRKIKAVGIDVASIDYGQSKDFKTHRIFYENNIPGFENVANLDMLPVEGAFIIALPVKIKGGSGGPLRIIAWIAGKE